MPNAVSRFCRLRWLPMLFAVFGLLLATEPCSASTSFPKRLKSRWGITGTLPAAGLDGCLLCHTIEEGGTGTATRSFAQTLRFKYSLAGGDIDALDYALGQAQKNADDSDHDGFSDYEELAVQATNPNDPGSHPDIVETTGGSGGAGGSSATPEMGGAPSSAGAGSANYEEPSQCTPTGAVFPTPAYGCQIQSMAPRGVAFPLLLAVSGFILHRARVGRRPRARSGSGRWF